MHVRAVKWDPGHWQVWKFYHPLQLGYKWVVIKVESTVTGSCSHTAPQMFAGYVSWVWLRKSYSKVPGSNHYSKTVSWLRVHISGSEIGAHEIYLVCCETYWKCLKKSLNLKLPRILRRIRAFHIKYFLLLLVFLSHSMEILLLWSKQITTVSFQ
jgi:hypothetical protein